MLIYVLVAAAAVLLLWPSTKPGPKPAPLLPIEPKPKAHPSYLDAVQALQTVRTRLAATDLLEDEQQAACNILTLALSAGSEQQ